MDESRRVDHREEAQAPAQEPSKRPYVKPTFQVDQVFETTALACGKVSPTQAQCRLNRRTS